MTGLAFPNFWDAIESCPMRAPAWLIGDPTTLPFLGHLRVVVEGPSAAVAVAARVGAGGDVVDGWRASRYLAAALRSAAGPGDRNALLWRVWSALASADAAQLGPAGGADLSMLLVAMDEHGAGVAGVGLSSVWGLVDGALVPLAEGAHPLLAPAGRPSRTPGVLHLDVQPTAVVGCPRHLRGEAPPVRVLEQLCGVRS